MGEPLQEYIPTPALNFVQIVGAKQRTPGGEAGVAVPLEEAERAALDQLLSEYARRSATASRTQLEVFERRARDFLLVYQEREKYSPVLDDKERKRLNRILEGPRQQHNYARPRRSSTTPWSLPSLSRRAVYWLIGAVLAIALGIPGGFAIYNAVNPANPMQHGAAGPANPPAMRIAPGTTDLQNLKQDWGPWQEIAPSDQMPQTGAPAFLLLENAGYFASQNWTIPANSSAWQEDLSNVPHVDVKGHYADITDADDNPYVVGISQPFVFASNPGTVLKVDPTGAVWAIPEAHAVSDSVRQAVPERR